MEKTRIYKYDNLKFFMIFLVVFGHCLEIFTGECRRIIYITIYTFHMPMFIFISGYFSKPNKKKILNFIYIYILWQTLYFLLDKCVLQKSLTLNYFKPNWLLWYIFSMTIWNILIKFFKPISNKYCWLVVVLSFIVSILVSFIEKVGYTFSLSRTITFFPYFLIGYFSKNHEFNLFDLKNNDKRNNIYKILFFIIIGLISSIYFIFNISLINKKWLYGSYSYATGGYNFVFKIMWILLSVSEIFLLNNITTNKKIPIISKIGTNTLTIYLIHGLIIKVLKEYNILFVFNEWVNILIALLLTSVIIILLGNDVTKKAFNKLLSIN